MERRGSDDLLSEHDERPLLFGRFLALWTTSAGNLIGRHHIALAHDGTHVFGYWDGVQVATDTFYHRVAPVGNFAAGGAGDGWLLVSDIAFYDADIGSTRILAHYNKGL